MKRCAVYVRQSTLPQTSLLDDRPRLCLDYAERNGWPVVAAFEDAELSGTAGEDRPGYQQLLEAARAPARPFDVVLVSDLSRVTRSRAQLNGLRRRLRRHAIRLVSAR